MKTETENFLIEIKTKIGTLYLKESKKDNSFDILDSQQYIVGSMYEEEIDSCIDKLKSIYHITGLCDVGVCENMFFARSKEDLLEVVNEYIQEQKENFDDWLTPFTLDELTKSPNYNIVGDNHILVNFS